MSDNIISRILQAEAEYHAAIKKVTQESETHKESLQKQQSQVLDEIKQQWRQFEVTSDAEYQRELNRRLGELERDFQRRKLELKNSQHSKIDLVSERLKKEVLSFYGDR